jgi:hypothetical protein
MVRLREISKAGPKLAKWTIGYYISTTLLAIGHSTIMTAFVWRNVFIEMDADSLVVSDSQQEVIDDRSSVDSERARKLHFAPCLLVKNWTDSYSVPFISVPQVVTGGEQASA